MLLKFKNFDKYNNPVFIVIKKDLPASYTMLHKYYKILVSKKFDTFLPIYVHNEHDYGTIRFFKNRKYKKFNEGATYNIDFNISTKVKNEKIYVNCYIKRVQFHAKAVAIDEGEIMNLDKELEDIEDF